MRLLCLLLLAFLAAPAHALDCAMAPQPLADGHTLQFEPAGTTLWKAGKTGSKKIMLLDKAACGEFRKFAAIDLDGNQTLDLVMFHEDESLGGITVWLQQKSGFKKIYHYELDNIPALLEIQGVTHLLLNAKAMDDLGSAALSNACKPSAEFYQELLAGVDQWSGRFKPLTTAYDYSNIDEAKKWMYRLRFDRPAAKLLKLDKKLGKFVPAPKTNPFLIWRKELLQKHFPKVKSAACKGVLKDLLQ